MNDMVPISTSTFFDALFQALFHLNTVFGILFLLVAVFWVVMLANMMVFSDHQLPGRHDKILWVVIFVLAAPLAPFVFWAFKHAYRGRLDAERKLQQLSKMYSGQSESDT